MLSATVPEERILDLVACIYDAAADPDRWPVFLEKFSDLVGGGATALTRYDKQSPITEVVSVIRYDPEYVPKYTEHYSTINPWRAWHARNRLSPYDSISTSEQRVPLSELEKTEFYNDYLLPQNTIHQFGCMISESSTSLSAFACLRGRAKGPFGLSDLDLLRTLFPHLQRAMQLHEEIASLKGQHRASMDALDLLAAGLVLLDHAGKIVLMNQAASKIIAANDGLTVYRNGLVASNRKQNLELDRIVSAAALISLRRGLFSVSAAAIQRPSGKRPFSVSAIPAFGDSFPNQTRTTGVIVLIRDPEGKTPVMENYLTGAYDLTPAECRLAERLVEGDDLVSAAQRLGVAHSTARTHLKRIFDKTETHHQGDLIRLLLKVG